MSEKTNTFFKGLASVNTDLDFHQDFADDADNLSIEYLARKTMAEGYEGRVSVGHLTALGAVPPDRLKEIAKLIADAGISVMCLPATDMHLGGADDVVTVLPMLTTNSAKALRLKNYGMEPGKDADMVLLDTRCVADAVIDQPEKLYVIKRGRIVVERKISEICNFF